MPYLEEAPDEAEGCGVCGQCACTCGDYEADEIDQQVFDYGARAPGILNWCGGLKTGRPQLGFEFECGGRDDSIHPIKHTVRPLNAAWRTADFATARGYAIAKEDGSIDGVHPMEIVTIPCTVEEHAQILWRAFPRGRFGGDRIVSWGNLSCGMHVHIGRSGISPLTLGKMLVLVNQPDNEDFWIDVCGRGPNSYARFVRCRISSVRSGGGRHRDGVHDRYEVLNLTNNRTIEFRLFRPSPRVHSILKNLEIVESLAEYCGECSIQPVFLGANAYLRWLSQNGSRKKYMNLHGWLMARESRFASRYRSFLNRNVRMTGADPKPGFPEET